MKLRFVKEPFMRALLSEVAFKAGRYSDAEPWLTEHPLAQTGIGDTGIEVDALRPLQLPDGAKGESLKDLENAKIVYSDLKYLTPEQAQDHRLWVYLTHNEHWKYMRARWPSKSYSIVKRRYLFEGANKDALIRNGVGRLWWFAHLTYDAARPNPFELTETLLSNQDIQQALLERAFGRNRNLLHAILEFVGQNKQLMSQGRGTSKNINMLAMRINTVGGLAVLDCMKKAEMTDMVRSLAGELC